MQPFKVGVIADSFRNGPREGVFAAKTLDCDGGHVCAAAGEMRPEAMNAKDCSSGAVAPPTVNLLHGDSRELIKTVPDASVDLILTDPPYNLGRYSTGNIHLPWRRALNNDVAEWDAIEFEPSAWVSEFVRVLKPSGNLLAFTSYNMLGRWHEAFDPVFDTFQFVVWHKTNPPPKVRKAGFLNSCELIVCCWNKGHTWNFGRQRDMHNFIESPICMGRERVRDPMHPTQKPLRVLKWLIERASLPGHQVFDPFMGVGSTGVAALNLERTFVGIECDRRYFEAAEKRLLLGPG